MKNKILIIICVFEASFIFIYLLSILNKLSVLESDL